MRDLALTTNGVLLAEHAAELRAAGLHRVTVSLDTLRPDRLRALTRGATRHADVLAGIACRARRRASRPLKINSVVLRGFNDDEIIDLLEFARAERAEVRFIEYMDVGGATHWSHRAGGLARRDPRRRSAAHYGPIDAAAASTASAPAERFRAARRHGVRSHRLDHGAVLPRLRSQPAHRRRHCGSSASTPRAALICAAPLRGGATDEELARSDRGVWRRARDRGAEQRASLENRDVLVGIERLRRDPHLEMHTRGGELVILHAPVAQATG